ncbi:hypothetical protein QOT17_000226 [Balamuthia mandrillaris]
MHVWKALPRTRRGQDGRADWGFHQHMLRRTQEGGGGSPRQRQRDNRRDTTTRSVDELVPYRQHIWNEDMHLCLAEQRGRYLQTFGSCLWLFIPVHPAAMQPSAVQLLTCDPTAKHTCLSLCVNITLCLGALYMGETKAAEDLFAAAREDMSYLFDQSDCSVAMALAQMMIYKWTVGDFHKASYYSTLCITICKRLGWQNSNANLVCLIYNAHCPLFSVEERESYSVAFWKVQKDYAYAFGFDADTYPLPFCIEHILYFAHFTQIATYTSIFVERCSSSSSSSPLSSSSSCPDISMGEEDKEQSCTHDLTTRSTLASLLLSLSQLLVEVEDFTSIGIPLPDYYLFYTSLSITALQAKCHLLRGETDQALQLASSFLTLARGHVSFCHLLPMTFLPRFRCVLQVFVETGNFHLTDLLLEVVESMSVSLYPTCRLIIDSFRQLLGHPTSNTVFHNSEPNAPKQTHLLDKQQPSHGNLQRQQFREEEEDEEQEEAEEQEEGQDEEGEESPLSEMAGVRTRERRHAHRNIVTSADADNDALQEVGVSVRERKKTNSPVRLRMQHWYEWKPQGDTFARASSFNRLVKK